MYQLDRGSDVERDARTATVWIASVVHYFPLNFRCSLAPLNPFGSHPVNGIRPDLRRWSVLPSVRKCYLIGDALFLSHQQPCFPCCGACRLDG